MVTPTNISYNQTKNKYKTLLNFTVVLLIAGIIGMLFPAFTQAQGLTDGYFRGEGNIDVTLSSTFENGDEFYAGETKMDVPPIYGEISRTTVSLYAAYGLTDDIDISLNLPYIFASGDTDLPSNEVPPQDFDSFQDAQLTVKWRPLQAQTESGTFNLAIAGAVSTPFSDYENGEAPDPQTEAPILVAIGDRATGVAGSLVAQYEFISGVFTSLEGGYRFYGKTTGDTDFDVPNASFISGKLGYGGGKYYGAIWAAGQFAADGTDIGGGPFPTNKVNYSRLGVTGSYSLIPSLSLNAAYFGTIGGRNTTITNGVTVGITLKPGR
jgi:hypothetical protein